MKNWMLMLLRGWLFIFECKYPVKNSIGSRLLGDEDLGASTKPYSGFNIFSPEKMLYGEVRSSQNYSLFSIGLNFNHFLVENY